MNNYLPKIDEIKAARIMELHTQNATATQIGREIGCTDSAIRAFLKKRGLAPNVVIKDKRKICKSCGKVFTPLYSGRDKCCSKECVAKYLSLLKDVKYSKELVNQIINLKKQLKTNEEIENITGADINKIKRTIKKYGAGLTPEQRQANCLKGKLDKDPDALKKMREAHMKRPTKELYRIIYKMKEILEKEGGTVQYLSQRYDVNPNSIRSIFHKQGWSHLIDIMDSGGQRELYNFVKLLLPNEIILYNNRDIIGKKEIDILIPSLQIGIEYCGIYWHSDEGMKPYKNETIEQFNGRVRNCHKDKMLECQKQNVRLITVFEDEWINRPVQVKNFLKAVLNCNINKIGARECILEQINMKQAKQFYEQYHIQGDPHFVYAAFGLKYNNELVGVISGGRHPNSNECNLLNLNRLCFKADYTIIGGASRLFNALMDWAKNNNYNKIISWSDNRWSEGDVYDKIGFMLINDSAPDYSYVKNDIRSNKRLFRKSPEELQYEGTEYELRKDQGYYRIWDCGKKTWVYILK